MLKYLSILLLSQYSFANEYYFPCDDNINEEECTIITDGYYTIKREAVAGWSNDTSIKDINLQNITINMMGKEQKIGSLVVKNYNVVKCDICEDKEPSATLTLKSILQSKVPKKYLSFIQSNQITNLKEFNKNGYLIAFNITNEDRYVIFFRDINNQIRVAVNTTGGIFMQVNCGDVFNLHFNSNNDFTVNIPNSVTELQNISQKNAEVNRVDMRIQNCRISYYHKHYAGAIYEKIQNILKN
jgi:hypothetical protein